MTYNLTGLTAPYVRMQFTGDLQAKPIVRFCIMHEWQIEIRWDYLPKQPMVRCMFHKGLHFIGKYEEGVFVEHFELGDFGAGINECENPTLRGLIQFFTENAPTATILPFDRREDADIIIKTIEVWAGKMKDVSHITVLQAGRNGSLDPQGEVVLSPDLPRS